MILLASSIVFATTTNQRYGKTFVYFNIPTVFSFNVTLPNNIEYESSASGQSTADEEFNATAPNDKNVTVWVKGTDYRQNSTVIGNVNNITNFKVNNTGNVNTNITMCINESLPSSMVLFGTKSADPYDSSVTVIPVCPDVWIANSSLATGAEDEFWIWANFTNAQISDSTQRKLYINSTET